MFYDLTQYMLKKADKDNPRNSEATIIECNDGSLLVAWMRFEKSSLGSSDSSPSTISSMRSYDNGKTWGEEKVVVSRFDNCINVYSPSFLRLNDGAIMLSYHVYNQLSKGLEQLTTGCYQISYDEGKTFSQRKTIWQRAGYAMANSCLIRLKSGRMIIPVVVMEGGAWTPSQKMSVSVIYSDNDSQSWNFSNHKIILPMRGAMEPFIAQDNDGKLIMVMRNQLGSVFKAYSYDDGLTWTKPQTTGLKCPESCSYIIKVPDSDKILIVWNNSEYDMSFKSHYGRRSPLTAALTSDCGETFIDFFNIETDPDYVFTNPGATFTKDKQCLLTYWTCPYTEDLRFVGLRDLKLSIFKILN